MKVVIIGNGIAGITTARHLRKLNSELEILVISGESEYFYSRPALMYIFMGHMKFEHTKAYEDWFWEKNRIDLKQAWVKSIDFQEKQLNCADGSVVSYDKLVLATGSKTATYDWPGQELQGVQGLIGLQDLDLLEKNVQGVKKAVIIGGGLIGVELAEMLHSRGIDVEILVRENRFWGSVLPPQEGKLIERHLHDHGVRVQSNTELAEIIGEGGKVIGIRTTSGEIKDCELVCIATGVRPNVDFLKGSTLEIERGILVDEFLKTNVEDVFAAGDCMEFRKPIEGRGKFEQMWHSGRMMGEHLAQTVLGSDKAYAPGVWYNAAKFFDVEYQAYGRLSNEPVSSFYWEHPKAKICLRMEHKDQRLVAMHAFGMRLRHQVADGWIRDEKSLEYCLSHFKDLVFDPEFHRDHSRAIALEFRRQFGVEVKLEKKSWKRILNAFAS